MSSKDLPPMPDPSFRVVRVRPVLETKPDNLDQETQPDAPVRLKPVLEREVESIPAPPTSEPVEAPAYPTKLRPPENLEEEEEDKATQPITSEATWNQNLMEADQTSRFQPKWMVSVAIIALGLLAALVWFLRNESPPGNSPPLTQAPTPGSQLLQQESWETPVRNILSQYLLAEQQGDHNSLFELVTESKETRTLLPKYQPQRDSGDTIDVSAFVAKPLPKSFTDNGIYLMYYQRPDSLSNEGIFRPIVPMRVRLSVDSPSFLEESVSRWTREKNRQHICAFFKQHTDGKITLDWPIFVQTRYRLLDRFMTRPHPETRHVFRLMIFKVQPTLAKNVYDKHLSNYDWYRIHCPGYPHESQIVAVDPGLEAGQRLHQIFELGSKDGRLTHAITAQLGWRASAKDGSPVPVISKIICQEFLNLNTQ